MIFSLPTETLLIVLPLLLMSLVIHEHAHARTAWCFGDATARDRGRMTLNPMAHLDFTGTLAMLFVGFGWAKPVPVNPFNLHPVRLGNIAVSLAGPASNLLLAVISLLLLRGLYLVSDYWAINDSVFNTVAIALSHLAGINILLCTFNLVPLYPLDGHHILGELLDYRRGPAYMQWQLQYGRILLMALLFGPMLLGQLTNNPDFPRPLRILYNYTTEFVFDIMGMI